MKRSKLVTTVVACALSACCVGAFAACGENGGAGTHTPGAMDAVKTDIVVGGYEWGPAIPKIVVQFKGDVSGVTKDTFAVGMKSGFSNAKRTVTDAYTCDEKGNKVTTASKYVAIEMSVKYGEANPFTYNQNTGRNEWTETIPVTVTVNTGKSFNAGDKKFESGDKFAFDVKAENRIVPQTATWHKDTVDYNENGKKITLSRASWAPEGATADSGKNPLVIWLHGGGEGGTDIDIALLGNEVTALTTDNSTNVQHYFKTDGLAGAYVLAVQSPTMWMDALGNDDYGDSGANKEPTGEPQRSYYTEALWKAITTYVDGNSDIDTDRIYIGGCSNGGYMTMNLAFEHGDYFAAYYPICQGYMSGNISDEMLADIKDYKMWFLLSEADNTLKPSMYTIPLYDRLVTAGAQNMHLTYLKNVPGVDDPEPSAGWGTKGFYDGHWSWINAFNDDVKTEMDMTKVNSIADLKPENCTKTGNMWEWIAAQEKGGGAPLAPITTDTFEAEYGVITDGKMMQSPGWGQPEVEVDVSVTVETGNKYNGLEATNEKATNLGYFVGEGTKVTWTITAAEECDVVITLHAAAAVQDQSGVTDFGTGAGLKTKPVDMSKNEYVKLTVNNVDATLNGTLPGINDLNWAALGSPAIYRNFGTATVSVHLNKGENTIVLASTHKQQGINIDKIVITSDVALTYTPTDNSDRVQAQQPTSGN